MALLYHDEELAKKEQKFYMDRKYFSSYEQQISALRGSRWVYVGNISFSTSEAQIYELFSQVGRISRVIMGLNSKTKNPCGFVFVEFSKGEEALLSVSMINGTILDDRQIRVELDFGYRMGRHLGRGSSGGQVRDERRHDSVKDAGRSVVNFSKMLSKHRIGFDKAPPAETRDSANQDHEPAESLEPARRRRRNDSDDEEEPEYSSKRRRRGDDDDEERNDEDSDIETSEKKVESEPGTLDTETQQISESIDTMEEAAPSVPDPGL